MTYENRSETEPLVVLRYFGPEVNSGCAGIGGVEDVRRLIIRRKTTLTIVVREQ